MDSVYKIIENYFFYIVLELMGVQKSKCPSVKKYTRLYVNSLKLKNRSIPSKVYFLNFKVVEFKFIAADLKISYNDEYIFDYSYSREEASPDPIHLL